jgi:hypothetical protein
MDIIAEAIVNFFLICFASFENPKTYQPVREKKEPRENNKIPTDILELHFIIIMSHINGKGLELTNEFCISY